MELCIQTGGLLERYGIEKTCEMIANANFTAVEVQLDHAFNGGDVWKNILPPNNIFVQDDLQKMIDFYQKDIDAINANGLKAIQAHAPFPAYVFDHPDFLDYSIHTYKNCVRYCEAVGIKNLVIHGINRPRGSELSYDDIKALNLKLYSSLIEVLEGTSVTVCLENLFRWHGGLDISEGICSDPYEAVYYVDTLNKACKDKPHFGLCLDTGHLNLTREEVRHYIGVVGNRLKCTHIHDNTGYGDDHRIPYAGTFSWENFLKALIEIDYKGYLSFETFAQYATWTKTLPEELIVPMLNAIGEIGNYFVDVVTGKTPLDK